MTSHCGSDNDENAYERMVRQVKEVARQPCEFPPETHCYTCATCYARETVKLLAEEEAAENGTAKPWPSASLRAIVEAERETITRLARELDLRLFDGSTADSAAAFMPALRVMSRLTFEMHDSINRIRRAHTRALAEWVR